LCADATALASFPASREHARPRAANCARLRRAPGMGLKIVTLRGGTDETSTKKNLKRVMSHQDIETETFGEQDTAEARYFAKDKGENEHRSLYGPSCTTHLHIAVFGSLNVPVCVCRLSCFKDCSARIFPHRNLPERERASESESEGLPW